MRVTFEVLLAYVSVVYELATAVFCLRTTFGSSFYDTIAPANDKLFSKLRMRGPIACSIACIQDNGHTLAPSIIDGGDLEFGIELLTGIWYWYWNTYT